MSLLSGWQHRAREKFDCRRPGSEFKLQFPRPWIRESFLRQPAPSCLLLWDNGPIPLLVGKEEVDHAYLGGSSVNPAFAVDVHRYRPFQVVGRVREKERLGKGFYLRRHWWPNSLQLHTCLACYFQLSLLVLLPTWNLSRFFNLFRIYACITVFHLC